MVTKDLETPVAKISLEDIASGYASTALLNDNFELIADALNNDVLYRDNPVGEANQMSNQLDMNSNRITNLGDAILASDAVNFRQLTSVTASGGSIDAEFVTYTPADTNYPSTNVKVRLDSLAASGGSDLVGYGIRMLTDRLDDFVNFADSGLVGDGVTSDTADFIQAIADATAGSTIYGLPGKTYLISGAIAVGKKLRINLMGATLKSAALSNTGIVATENFVIENGICDNVYIAWDGANVTYGKAKELKFINQTYSNTTAYNGAQGVIIDKCEFAGKAKGPDGLASYSCLQLTAGGGFSKFTNNRCIDVVAGINFSGGTALSDNAVVSGNYFKTLELFALKTDAANYAIFENNYIEDAAYGVFYEALTVADTYAQGAGDQMVCTKNTFVNVDDCLYCTAATNKWIRGVFTDNYMTSCRYGIRRSVGHLVVANNHFYNGKCLYYYGGGSLPSWDLTIENNVIYTTTEITDLGNDTDGTPIKGAIILGALTDTTYKTAIMVRNNTFHDYHTNAIMVASIGAYYPKLTINDNKFDAGSNSVNHMVIGACDDFVCVHNREITAPSGEKMHFPRTDRVSKMTQYYENDWQYGTASPTTGTHVIGERFQQRDPAASGYFGWLPVFVFTTTLSAGEPSGETSMAVASGTDTANADIIGVKQDDGTIRWTTIASGGGTTTLVLTAALTADAALGSRVYVYRWKQYGSIAA